MSCFQLLPSPDVISFLKPPRYYGYSDFPLVGGGWACHVISIVNDFHTPVIRKDIISDVVEQVMDNVTRCGLIGDIIEESSTK